MTMPARKIETGQTAQAAAAQAAGPQAAEPEGAAVHAVPQARGDLRESPATPPVTPAAAPPGAPDAGADAGAAAPGAPPAAARKRRPLRVRLLMFAVPVAIAVAGGWFWLAGGRYVTTDNAYVHQAMVPVSPDVSGRITEVLVAQNQPVARGDVLFRLDPEPFEIEVARAEAALAQARLAVDGLRAAHGVAAAQLEAAQRALEIQHSEYDRQAELQGRGLATPAALDTARLSLNAAESAVALARQQLTQAAAALGGDPGVATDDVPSVQVALAAARAAGRDLDHATVRAPEDGLVAQTDGLNVGQFVAAGTMALSLVATGDTWVEANFKETQLTNLAAGQPVTLSVDAYPGVALTGTVESFSGATGAQFSLIPAQNATGNWVKVVQRLPVRVRLDAAAPGEDAPALRNGMSVDVSVDTGKTRLERMR